MEKKEKNSEIFITSFNRIERKLKSLLKNKYIGFSKSVKILKEQNPIVKRYAEDLLEYAELRNAIVHNKINTNYAIAEPHDSVIKSIKKVEKELLEPRKVIPLFACDVYTFQVDDRLSDLLHVIYQKGYTKFPVYEGNQFQGLISPKGIAKWMSKHAADMPSSDQVTLREVLGCVERNNYRFIKPNVSVYRAEDIFKEQIGRGNRIEALFITKNSTDKEDLQGIITNWDIMKI